MEAEARLRHRATTTVSELDRSVPARVTDGRQMAAQRLRKAHCDELPASRKVSLSVYVSGPTATSNASVLHTARAWRTDESCRELKDVRAGCRPSPH